MPQDIYINTGTSFQQQYTKRTPTQTPTIGQDRQPLRQPLPARQPFTYQRQQPGTYSRQVNRQTHYIANRQNAYPYIASNQTPYIANRQNAYPYIAASQTPIIASDQQPYPYIAAGQQPYIANRQNNYPYIANSQSPYTANAQQTYPYIAASQTPYIANAQSPVAANQRQPYIANGTTRSPFNWVDSITSVYAYDSDSAYDDNANASARIRVFVRYNTVPNNGQLEAYIRTFGGSSSSHSSSTRCFYIPASQHTVATGGYTVRFTTGAAAETGTYGPTNLDGDDNASTITATASAVPTAVTTKYFEWEVTAEAEPIGTEEELADFTLNLIFEHASLPTLTYVCDWSLKAEADADGGE
jgi:hypothetical protein